MPLQNLCNQARDIHKTDLMIKETLNGYLVNGREHGRVCPAFSDCLDSELQAGESLEVGLRTVERLQVIPVQFGKPAAIRPVWLAERMLYGQTHIRETELGLDRAVGKLHEGMNNALW